MWILSGHWKDHCDKCGEPAARQRRGVSSLSLTRKVGVYNFKAHTGVGQQWRVTERDTGLGGVMGEGLSQTSLTRFLLKTGQGFGHSLGWNLGMGRGTSQMQRI